MENHDSITLGHGAGGLLSQQLIKQEFLPLLAQAGQLYATGFTRGGPGSRQDIFA